MKSQMLQNFVTADSSSECDLRYEHQTQQLRAARSVIDVTSHHVM